MSTKNHARSPDKKGFSIALPIVLIDQIQAIAEKEARSRNGQIQKFLDESIKRWDEDRKPIAKPHPLQSLPNIKESKAK